MRRTVPLLLLLAASACRDFKIPPEPAPPKLVKGTACAEPAQCESGVCAQEFGNDPLCCERECAADETCVDGNHRGSCVVRLPGTPCEKEPDCPQAMSCVDGVCCLSGCAPWQACNLANHLGTCTNRRELGEVCTSDADCPAPLGELAGHCEKGVCCVRKCAQWEACVDGGQRCEAPRSLGDSCAAASECPPPPGSAVGFCVDGVCCDQACTLGCRSCARPGLEGACGLQEFNSDLRQECGTCQACFWGNCEPAIVGTAPKEECGPGPEEVCDIVGLCGLAGGAACTLEGETCAVGSCLGDRCLRVAVEKISAEGLSSRAVRRDVYGFDQNGVGDSVAVVEELVISESGSYAQRTLLLLQKVDGGDWAAAPLDACSEASPGSTDPRDLFPMFAGAAVMQGRTAYVAGVRNSNLGWCELLDPGDTRSGVWGQTVAFNGERGALEEIDAAAYTTWVVLRTHPQFGLAAAYLSTCDGADCVKVRRRTLESGGGGRPQGVWSDVFQVALPSTGNVVWDMEIVEGIPTVMTGDGASLRVWQPGSAGPTSEQPHAVDLSFCQWPAASNLILARAERTDPATGTRREGLGFTLENCRGSMFRMRAELGAWWPQDGAAAWSFEPDMEGALLGLPSGGAGGVGIVWDDGSRPVARFNYSWLDAAGQRVQQSIFTPFDHQDLSPVTGVGRTTPTGNPVFLLAAGDPANPPVPKDLYVVAVRP
ncbi:MAG TPA: hypothetical protein VGK67_07350 [Myxococcales bacterium]|jgi:hypothetical protein